MTLRVRLLLSVGTVVLASLAAVFLASTRVVGLQLEQLKALAPEQPPDISPVATALERHHAANGWRGVQPLLARLRTEHGGEGRELLLLDSRGRLIAASSLPEGGVEVRRNGGGLRLSYELDGGPVQIMVRGMAATVGPQAKPLATVHFVPPWRSREREAARQVNRWLLIVVAATGIAALLFTAALARNIVRPLEQLQAAVQRIEEGNLGQTVAVTSNDEVGKLARAFNAMSAQLAHDEVLRRNMVNDVAHELRTPLTNLICSVEAMQDGLRAPTAPAIDSLHDDLLLLQRLVDDLQTLTLAEAGKLPLHRELLEVREEVERCVRAQSESARVRVDAVEGLIVNGDRVRFQQIVSNLLRNALTHGAATQIDVTARAAGDEVELIVADDGPGIAPEHLPHIFDRFYRADPSRDRATGGAGLGLAIVKNLVELHGGRIEVRSEAGRGAAFHLRLPRAG